MGRYKKKKLIFRILHSRYRLVHPVGKKNASYLIFKMFITKKLESCNLICKDFTAPQLCSMSNFKLMFFISIKYLYFFKMLFYSKLKFLVASSIKISSLLYSIFTLIYLLNQIISIDTRLCIIRFLISKVMSLLPVDR